MNKWLFEDIFDDVKIDTGSDERKIEVFQEEKELVIDVEVTNIAERNRTNFKRIGDKLVYILKSSILFDNVRIDSAEFSIEDKPQFDKKFSYDELPDYPDYIKMNVNGTATINMRGHIRYTMMFVSGKLMPYKQFCKELFRIMSNVSGRQITYYPTSYVYFEFPDEDGEIIRFGDFSLPMERDLGFVYNYIFPNAEEPSEEERKYTIHDRIKEKTNIEKVIEWSLEKLKKDKGIDIEILSIDENIDTLIIFELNAKNYNEKTTDAAHIVEFLKKNIIDNVPNHYLMVRRVCLAVWMPKTLKITDIGNRTLKSIFNNLSDTNGKKTAKIEPVIFKQGDVALKTNRFTEIRYTQGGGKGYVMILNMRGRVFPDKAEVRNVELQYMFDKTFNKDKKREL